MRVGRYRFKPRVWAVAAFLCVALVMLALGRWQLHRAAEKAVLLAAAEQARLSAPVPLETLTDLELAAERYSRVSITGEAVTSRQFLWDNRSHDGRAGYEVITPVRLSDGQLVLVNRGWIAPGSSRSQLPDVADTDGLIPDTMTGLFSRPSKGFMSGPAMETGAGWPRLLQFFDYPALESALGEPLVPGLVQLQEADAPISAPHLFKANWRAAASGPEKHYSYAFQWFAMALGLTGIFVAVNTSRIDR